MAIFHCSIKIIGRSGGRSAVASAAYRSGEKLYNEETGIVHDFTRKGGVVMSEILLPDNVPDRFLNREILWNEVQKVEKRSDAQLAREIEVALPVELSREQQMECVRNYIGENFTSKGMIADWALHDKGDGNPHAHILLSVRGMDEKAKWQTKQKSVFANARDEKGRPVYDPSKPSYDPKDKEHTAQYRIPVLDENGNQKTRVREGKGTEYLWERISIPANDWNEHSKAEEWRKSWAEQCNRYLAPEARIDHRSYQRQGIDLEPTIHEGVSARQMERWGAVSERCETNRGVRQRNLLRLELKALAAELTAFITEKARGLYGKFTRLTGTFRDIGKAGADDGLVGKTAGRDYDSGAAVIGAGTGTFGEQGGFGRIHVLEREFDKRKQESYRISENICGAESEIADTDWQIEVLTRIKEQKEAERNERIKKLMELRRASGTAHRGTRGNQPVTGRERTITDTAFGNSGNTGGGETDALIRSIKASISLATDAEQAARTDRTDREAEQRRLDLERQREVEERQRKTHRGKGFDR